MAKNTEQIPSNLDEAVEFVKNKLIEEDTRKIKDRRLNLGLLHHSFGRWIRNNWGLWSILSDDIEETEIALWFKEKGIVHADDMSGIILSATQAYLRDEPYNLKEDIKKYRSHWEKQGIDPDTMK